MPEQRNPARMWMDRLHYITSACTLAFIVWIASTAQTSDKNDAVFRETLLNINSTITSLNTRISILETIRIEIAESHYKKPEVQRLVDGAVAPLQRDFNRFERSTNARLDKIYDEVKK
jgi:hypothetical protein